jgi:hypothetical protein
MLCTLNTFVGRVGFFYCKQPHAFLTFCYDRCKAAIKSSFRHGGTGEAALELAQVMSSVATLELKRADA